MILAVAMATEEAKYILTTFLLVLSGTDHCVKVSSNSETMRAEIFWWLQRIDIKHFRHTKNPYLLGNIWSDM